MYINSLKDLYLNKKLSITYSYLLMIFNIKLSFI